MRYWTSERLAWSSAGPVTRWSVIHIQTNIRPHRHHHTNFSQDQPHSLWIMCCVLTLPRYRCCEASSEGYVFITDCEMIQIMVQLFTNSNVLMKCDFYVCWGNFIQNANKNKMKIIHPSPGLEEVISVAGKIFSGFYFLVTWPGPGLGQAGGWAPLWGRNWLPCPDQSRCQGARDRDTTPLSQHSKPK